jgi:polysaccharide deacetylase family protein (PEP-CTERM system associated)
MAHDKTPSTTPPAAMSIDVEDWFQVENLKSVIPRDSWETQDRRVEANTDRMLEIMAQHGATSTCFILGWIAQRHPELVQRIAAAGHEIASHGFNHELIYNQSPEDFKNDVISARHLLQDLTGQAVVGYRAPSFSITDWSIDILAEAGYLYDSSSFPTVAHDRYGTLTGIEAGTPVAKLSSGITEVCVSCVSLGRRGIPWGGGGYFRLIPYSIFHRGVSRILKSGMPYVFYIHPWEIDAGQPRQTGLKRSHAFRHYVNLRRGESRFERLIRSRMWGTVQSVIDWHDAAASSES